MKYYFLIVLVIFIGSYAKSETPQTVNTTSTAMEKVYSSYSASFYSAAQLQILLQNGGRRNDLEYDRSLYLLRAVTESKYRTKQYTDLRMEFDRLATEQENAQKRKTQIQNELTQFLNSRTPGGRRNQNGNNSNTGYETQKQIYTTEINQYQSQVNNYRAQQQKVYTQMLTEQLAMYSRAQGDEYYLNKVLYDYAAADLKQTKQAKNNEAQLKAREEERQAEVDWQAWVTFEYLSKYSTLDARLEHKEITYTEYEKERDKLDKEKIDKLKMSRKEARDAFEETYKRLTTAHDTTIRVPNF